MVIGLEKLHVSSLNEDLKFKVSVFWSYINICKYDFTEAMIHCCPILSDADM